MSDKYIGDRIRELREMQGYTREAFAEKADISSKFLYEIEMGKKGFSADTLSRIAQALFVSCDYIMFGENPGYFGGEKIVCVLESLKPTQMSQIRDILKILSDMCDLNWSDK